MCEEKRLGGRLQNDGKKGGIVGRAVKMVALCLALGLTLVSWSQSVDPRAAMIAFVEAIAAHVRAGDPAFAVFPQNAAELAQDPGYLATVTGIGQEDTFYGYKAPGRKSPAKATALIETGLDVFKTAGKLVLTVDYPFHDQNRPVFNQLARRKIDRLYGLSLEKGYVPYATVLNLDWLTMNPGHFPNPNHGAVTAWSQVQNFAYQLQPSKDESREAFLSALGSSGYDLIVMDYSFDGSGPQAFRPGEIAALRNQCGCKLLAYVSIGEAESYRWYWQSSWGTDPPPWLGPENPNWPGDYRVRYWDPAWQAIVFQYLDQVMAQGFDGVYLDTVDTYEYWQNHPTAWGGTSSKEGQPRHRPGGETAPGVGRQRRGGS